MNGLPGAFLFLSAITCLVASIGYTLYWRGRKSDVGFWATVVAVLGWLFLSAGGGLRAAAGEPLMLTFADRLLLFLWLNLTAFLIAGSFARMQAAGAFVMPLVTAGLWWAISHQPAPGGWLHPAAPAFMQSLLAGPWLTVHIGLVFAGYSAFTLAGIASALYLLHERDLKAKRKSLFKLQVPPLQNLDRISRRLTAFGFPLLTAGILIGAVVAQSALDHSWMRDAKVIGSFVIWGYYALCLGARYVTGWQGRPVAFWTAIGLLGVLFNFFGLSWLAPGFHRFG